MQITSSGNNEYTISGDIKTISDYQEIKSTIQSHIDQGGTSVEVKINDSQTITSSVVGYFMKLVNLNNVKVTLHVQNDKLHKMLEDLVLVSVFNVKKI